LHFIAFVDKPCPIIAIFTEAARFIDKALSKYFHFSQLNFIGAWATLARYRLLTQKNTVAIKAKVYSD